MGQGSSQPTHFDLIKDGDSLADVYEHAAAIERYTEAIQLAPRYWVAYLQRAKSHLALNASQLALVDINTAVELQDTVTARRVRRDVYAALAMEEECAAEDRAINAMKARSGRKARSAALGEAEYWDGVEADEKRRREVALENTDFGKWMKDHKTNHRRREAAKTKSAAEAPVNPEYAEARKQAAVTYRTG